MKQLIITTIATLLIVGCAKNDITLLNKGKKDWEDIEGRAGGKVFEIEKLKSGVNRTLFFKIQSGRRREGNCETGW